MALISIPNTFTVGAVIVASQHNANFSTIYSDYNGNIDNSNISATANIGDTKLAQITTAGKVSGAALTALASIPAGAGLVPVANIDTGTTANKIVQLTAAAKLPAVDGSLLTGLTATLSSIKDYGTSTSSSTAKNQADLKIAYGQYSFASNGSQAITNLSFTSTTSYQVTLGEGYSVSTTENIRIIKDSASQFTIYNDIARACVVNWQAIGT